MSHSNYTQCSYICYSAWLWPKMTHCTRPTASVGLTKFLQPTSSMALKTSAWGKMNFKPYMTAQEFLWPLQFPLSNSGTVYTTIAPHYILHKADNVRINAEAHSCNQCCSEKAITITFVCVCVCVCVCAALVIRHARHMCHIVICGLPSSAVCYHIIS